MYLIKNLDIPDGANGQSEEEGETDECTPSPSTEEVTDPPLTITCTFDQFHYYQIIYRRALLSLSLQAHLYNHKQIIIDNFVVISRFFFFC